MFGYYYLQHYFSRLVQVTQQRKMKIMIHLFKKLPMNIHIKGEGTTLMEFNESDPLYYTSKESNAQILFNKGIPVFMLVM